MQDTQWARVRGSITKTGEGVTIFFLEAWGPEGGRWAQRCECKTARFEHFPNLYGRILDQMTEDIARRIS